MKCRLDRYSLNWIMHCDKCETGKKGLCVPKIWLCIYADWFEAKPHSHNCITGCPYTCYVVSIHCPCRKMYTFLINTLSFFILFRELFTIVFLINAFLNYIIFLLNNSSTNIFFNPKIWANQHFKCYIHEICYRSNERLYLCIIIVNIAWK